MEKEELIKKIMSCCFADDSIYKSETKKYDYTKDIFWKNFRDWEKNSGGNDFSGIYNSKRYDTLRDPDALSQNLYIMHENIWNFKCHKFHIPQVKKLENECKLKIDEKNIILSSDSFISIYWHWKRMKTLMLEIQDDKDNLSKEISQLKNRLATLKVKENDRCFNNKFSLYKTFIWYYLQYANTIGGFIVFPRTYNSINVKRASSPICDRFDLTLECIRRAYQYDDFYRSDANPLFGISKEDKEFFKMFGTFQNYAKFFCLDESYDDKHNWVNETGQVLNLFDNQPLDNWDFNKSEVLPTADNWWTFYRNIMDRLEARNKQIEELLRDEKCSEGELQELYDSLYLEKH